MTTTIGPCPNSSTDDIYAPEFPSSTGLGMVIFREAKADPMLSKAPKVKAKKFITEAQGKANVGKKAKLKTSKKPKNLRVGKKKKLGAFGETYEKVAAPDKGIRVTESNRFRESVSVEDLRGMLQRSLREYYPPKMERSAMGAEVPCSSSYSSTPYIKDILPEEKLVVFTKEDVLWGANYTINEKDGKAKLSGIRRVESKYVDFADEDEDDAEAS